MTSPPLFYTTREAAHAARKGEETIRRAIRAGKLTAGRTGDLGDFVINPADLLAWLGLPAGTPLPLNVTGRNRIDINDPGWEAQRTPSRTDIEDEDETDWNATE